MIRVFVVDDEPFLRQNIKNTIEAVNSSFHVIGMAGDGEAALAAVHKLHPDVIFIDIRMPIMDGLELLKQMHEEKFQPISVILSGYSDFAYAQQALQYQAFDYILKPIDKKNLKKLLTKIEKKLCTEVFAVQTAHLQSLLNHTTQVPTPEEAALAFSSFDSFSCIYLCEGSYPSNPYQFLSTDDCFWTEKRLFEMIKDILTTEESAWILAGGSQREHFLVIGHQGCELSRVVYISHTIFENIQSFSPPVTCIHSRTSTPLNKLRNIMIDLKHMALSKNLFSYPSLSDCTKTILPTLEKMGMTASAVQKLSFYAKEKQTSLFLEYAYTIVLYCKTEKCSQLLLTHMLKKLCEIANKGVQNLLYDEQISSFITNSYSYEELWKNIQSLLREIIQPSAPDGMDSIIIAIHEYIETHFTEALTLKSLAEPYHVSVSYMCSLYKKNYEVSPIDDIINRRVEAAKKLLLSEPPLTIRQIAEMVGYSDSYYFSRLFKVITGTSPTQYRKSNEPAKVQAD